MKNDMLYFTDSDLDKTHNDVLNNAKYGPENKLITDCIKMFPLNKDINEVSLKICLIDVTNSTHLSQWKKFISVVDLANIIVNIKDIDTRIQNGDPCVVSEIAKETKDKYNINLFSFASKYCCYHNCNHYNKDDYSIYDNVLMHHLPKYSNVTSNQIQNWRKSCDYKAYNDCIGKILTNNGINTTNRRRKFDHFVWWNNRHKLETMPSEGC